jgi:hypothetical protein
MAPNKGFEKALHEALSAMTPIDEPDAAHECPAPEMIAGHIRGTQNDEEVAAHISSCDRCTEFASDIKRRQKLYERQKLAFTQLAQEKYPSIPILKETFQPFAWMLNRKALIPEVALAVALVAAVTLNYHSSSHVTEGSATLPAEVNSATSAMKQIENSDPRRPADSAVLLEKFHTEPDLVRQVDAAHVAQARFRVSQKKVAVADDPKLADQWSNIEGKLQAYEFIARYNSLRKQADGSPLLARVADVEGKNGSVTISFDQDPVTDRDDSKLLTTSAVETPGLNQVIILTPQRHWRLDAKNDFEVAADSHQNQKPHE